MGGIIGKLSFHHDETLARPVLDQMLAALRHRGAWGRGVHVVPGIALAWCGDHAAPITRPAVAVNADATVHVVADASLTNARDLRLELERRGYVLNGRTDADLIAHAYDAWGDACVEHLRGPFACAIWDDVRERLLLARDPLGARPLFFAVLHGHGLVFASEIRALLADPGVSRTWCPQAIDAYLAFGYIPAPLTAYERVSKVEPAQRLVMEGRRLRVEPYRHALTSNYATLESGSHTIDALEEALTTEVRAALSSSPATGVLYSGGLASAAILATVRPRDSRVVTVAMDGSEDAVRRGQAAATHLGFDPTVELVAPNISAMAQRLTTYLDEPLGDPEAVAQYATFLAARLHMRSAVTGHGAASLWPEDVAATEIGAPLWAGQPRRELYTRGFAWQVSQADPFGGYLAVDAVSGAAAAGHRQPATARRRLLLERTLVVAERAATAAGLQLRSPFLEPDVANIASAGAARATRRHGHPLCTLLARHLPASLLPGPLSTSTSTSWLAGALAVMVPAILLGRRFDSRGIVSRLALQRLWDEHSAGRHDHALRLWSLLMLEFWFREYIDGDAAVDEPFEYAILRAA